MAVLWTIQAQRHLRQALAGALGRECELGSENSGSRNGVLEKTLDDLNDLLAMTFPGASVVVKDQMIGYRRKKDLFVLLVESFSSQEEHTGPFVVKIGTQERLKREFDGWERTRPPGLRHDLVFLDLRKVPDLSVDGQPWMSLVYGDAQQFLGVAATITLEEAVLNCVRSSVPRILSLGVVITELFERIGHLMYSQAFVDQPWHPNFALDLPRLDTALDRWETDPSCLATRRDISALANSGVEQFLDPIDYLRYVQSYVPWRSTRNHGTAVIEPAPISAPADGLLDLPQPKVTDLVPRMLRGCAHGDLHGRNILVGIVRERAMWPTVFDYEDMSPRNLIGWDFVKLETELKFRAYVDLFAGLSAGNFIQQVQGFEIELAFATEEYHRNRSWPEPTNTDKPDERLRSILLLIRRMAAQHLGSNPGRPNDWLEEYYFLLACYGVFTSRFENLAPRERIGALLSGGVATARLSWPRAVA